MSERLTKKAREAKESLQAAFDAGAEFYPANRDEMLTAVYRYANATYPVKDEAMSFVLGYMETRATRAVGDNGDDGDKI